MFILRVWKKRSTRYHTWDIYMSIYVSNQPRQLLNLRLWLNLIQDAFTPVVWSTLQRPKKKYNPL